MTASSVDDEDDGIAGEEVAFPLLPQALTLVPVLAVHCQHRNLAPAPGQLVPWTASWLWKTGRNMVLASWGSPIDSRMAIGPAIASEASLGPVPKACAPDDRCF